MLFHTLREALLDEIRTTISSGAFTERSLARFLGVSQPHLHNVLNGTRALTFHLADHIITKLEIPWDSLLANLLQ
ncbi:MAG: XRE family transcriptional regulator [Bryobacteraceae bacterium]